MHSVIVSLCLFHSAGYERADADHRLARGGGLCRQLVWKGEVSTARFALGRLPADSTGLDTFYGSWVTRAFVPFYQQSETKL